MVEVSFLTQMPSCFSVDSLRHSPVDILWHHINHCWWESKKGMQIVHTATSKSSPRSPVATSQNFKNRHQMNTRCDTGCQQAHRCGYWCYFQALSVMVKQSWGWYLLRGMPVKIWNLISKESRADLHTLCDVKTPPHGYLKHEQKFSGSRYLEETYCCVVFLEYRKKWMKTHLGSICDQET